MGTFWLFRNTSLGKKKQTKNMQHRSSNADTIRAESEKVRQANEERLREKRMQKSSRSSGSASPGAIIFSILVLVAIAVFAIGHPSGQKLSNQASRKFGLGGRSSNGGDFDVDSSGGDAVDVSEELAPSETMSEEDREEIAAEEAEEAQEEAAEEAAKMGLNNDAAEAVPSRSNMDSMARWAALGVPEVCIRPGVAPSGVIPGLELHDRYDDAFYTKPAGTTAAHTDKVQHTEEQQAEHEDAKEEIIEEKEEEAELAAEEGVTISDEEQTEDETKLEVGQEDAETIAGASSDEGEKRRARSLLGKQKKAGGRITGTPLTATSVQNVPLASASFGRERYAGPETNPLLVEGMSENADDIDQADAEQRVMFEVAKLSLFDIACQFANAECADAAALQLAAALRADAEAVINPDVSPEELTEVSARLSTLHSNPRTMLNSSKLPAMGKSGELGSCALTSDAEYDPSGQRFDATVSRFASVIDVHDTLVYCAPDSKFCKFTKLTEPITETTVRLDAASYLMAKAAGKTIHSILANDEGLGRGISNWGYEGEPTHNFITTLMLLRSGLCARLDVYGQPSIPLDWFRSQGYGHITAIPGDSEEDQKLAKTLVQERYAYRVVMDQGKMCFFK